MRSLLRILVGTSATIVGLILISILGCFLLIRSSLPSTGGSRTSSSITDKITIDRDKWGVPLITAQTRESISYGVGFCHGQDRFFHMDLTRRVVAGELAALVGSNAIDLDREARIHTFRERSKLIFNNLEDYEKMILEHYTRGVNEGLNSLRSRPPEYWLLNSKPLPWSPEDSILVIFAFYMDLQNNPDLDYARWVARQTLPKEVVNFIDGKSHAWEAAIDGSQFLQTDIPGPEVFSYLKATNKDTAFLDIPNHVERMPGSNNWVVGPDASTTGTPILAGDPHLNLGVPNTWYKLSYSYIPDDQEEWLNIHGFGIPGTPSIAIGTNEHIAWALTNSSLDTDDLIILEPGDSGFPEFKTKTGTAQIQQKRELIEVKGEDPVAMEIEYTQWGPVIGETPTGEKRVRRWAAYHPDAINVKSMLTEQYVTTQDFLDHSHEANLPVQNFIMADTGGNIAWTIAGFLPDRHGADPFEAIYASDPTHIWNEKLKLETWPQVLNPENDRLWTANNRVYGSDSYMRMGSGDYSEFPRAFQVREKLLAKEKHSPQNMIEIQHDNAVSFLIRWQNLLLGTLEKMDQTSPDFIRLKEEVTSWNGRADVDSTGYTLIRDFRSRISVEVLRHITLPAIEFDPEEFDPFRFMTEEAVYQIVARQPEYLLNPIYSSWQEQFAHVVESLLTHIEDKGWESIRWGRRNVSDYRHPMTYALPALNGLLSMPQIELEGDHYCPKVLSHSLAAGIRIIMTPGKLEESLFQMGCGQSGHFLSKNYSNLQSKWATDEYLPLLPGEPVSTLTILPN